jgi:hypothetical protein
MSLSMLWKKVLLAAASVLGTLFVLAGLAAAAIAWQGWYDGRQSRIQDDAALGSSRAQLEASAGAPNWVTDGTRYAGTRFEKSPSERTAGCVLEYWYQSPIHPLPSRYSYCFDKDGRLVHKYHWVSW